MSKYIDPAQIVNSQPPSGFDASRPGPSQVGTLGEELAAILAYYEIPDDVRRADRKAAKQAARWQTMQHTRVVVDGQGATP